MDRSWLKRNWSTIRIIPIAAGILVILAAFLFINPSFVEKFSASPSTIEIDTIRVIFWIKTCVLALGLCLILLFFILRVHNPRNEKLLTISGLILCSLILLIFMVEITLNLVDRKRHFNTARQAYAQFDDFLGWVNKPNRTFSSRGANVRTNSLGFRGGIVPFQKPKDEFRILFLGDSQLFGIGVDEEHILTSILENNLQSVKTINTGVIGYGTDQEFLALKSKGIKFSPDLIIVVINAHDLTDNINKTMRNGYSKPVFKLEGEVLRLTNVPVSNFGSMARFNKRLQEMSQIYYIGSRVVDRMMANRFGQQKRDKKETEEQEHLNKIQRIVLSEEEFLMSIAVTLRLLKEIAAVGKSTNAKTVVIFLPYEMDFRSYEIYNKYVENSRRQISDYSDEGGFFFYEFQKEMAARKSSKLYLDDLHFNKEGHKLVADILREYLSQSKLLPEINTE